ncbi:MAG: UvrD-helicase domain-containing protein [Clostridia bacterium]|nr:UvrD-helicase domain-containing protein [Clostridia bacterium]
MRLTDTQNSAVVTRNKDLLVCAGAGSGKTTVLTQRLIERIKGGDSVTDFLVVTFMKAAASDIKRKLYDALIAESALQPDNKHLYRQTFLIPEADICTISSYCLALVKENFSLLGISPRVRVIDETESAMLLKRVADSLIEDGYNNEDERFLLLADNFSGDKNDDPLRDSMIKLYNTLRVTLSRKEMLLSCASRLRKEAEITEDKGFFETESGVDLRARLRVFYDDLLEAANDLYAFAATVATDEKYIEPIGKLVEACENVRESVETNYVNYCSVARASLASISLARSGCDPESREKIKEIKASIVKTEKSLYERYCRGSERFIAESFKKTASIIEAVDEFLDKLEKGYERAKSELSALDYTDFERKALDLLEISDENGEKVPSELCLKKQKSFKEILIDEYQDVNPMQDRIFTLLSGGSHRFMVGDVKQSIYRFRNAYPDIFLGYKDEYPDISDSEGSKSACIFLRENFRCSQTVIDYVNYLFKTATENTAYYREYENEWLIHASTRPERSHPVVVAVAEKEKDKAKEARQSEAEFIAREILRLVSMETADDGSQLSYKDFAVMLGAMKGYSIEYEKAFNKYGIPYKTENSENFLENPDIRLAISALKAIDRPNDDISLCALMRSPICNFSSEDLYRIRRVSSQTEFWNAVIAFALPKRSRINEKRFSFKRSAGSNCLTVRSRSFIRRLTAWRRESAGVPCKEFLKSFFVSSGILNIAVSSGNRESLLLLYEYARKYETGTNIGLSAFLDYIGELSESGKEISDAARSGDEDAVSFITVHKSKGLEFKVCFLAGTEKRFSGLKASSEITVLRREGIFFRLRDRENMATYDPICNVLAADKEHEAILGEELRKLYVALTRAKERLYITGCAESGYENAVYSPITAKSWLDLIIYASSFGEKSFFDMRSISKSDAEGGFIPPPRKRMITPTAETVSVASYVYPFASSVATAAKISVSELREGLLEDDEYNRATLSVPLSRVSLRPSFANDNMLDAGEIGTANHVFMQFCNFQSIEKGSVSEEAKRLVENKTITPLQFEMLDIPALERFFKSELYKRITASKRVYREKRFSVKDNLGANGESVLVQGVIDCFFENPDGSYTVVDYKTDRVKNPSELVNRHRVQLSCYCRAVERMTGRKVSEALLYSFALGREIAL